MIYRLAKKKNLKAEINVVPYIDVMLVLLIIFMVLSPLLIQGVEVDLPQTDTTKMSVQNEPLVISIDKNGNYYWYDFENDEIKVAYDCKYFDFKALKASNQLIYENYIGEPIEHSYRYNFRHWSLVKVDSVINLDSGNFVLE